VTFIGSIDGYETRKIGDYDYRFPRVEASVIYLWPRRDRVDVMVVDPYPYPYYYPFRGWRPSGYL
jgi:outer membrane lipoprotein